MTETPMPRPPLTILMHARDNVAIVANDGGLAAGTVFASGLTLREKVPQAHKVALVDIPEGGVVRRYDVAIGYALKDIPAGSWVGEGSVIKREPRHYDVVAVRRTRIVHVPRATFRWLLDTNLDFNHYIIDHLNERLAQFMAMVETDRIDDPRLKLARSILSLFNPVLYPGMGSALLISQEELGELAGLSRQRTNAAIKALERADLVHANYGSLLVKDLQALRSFARNGS